MGLRALTAASADLPIGGQWVVVVETRTIDGYLTSDTPAMVVTLPAGSIANVSFTTVTAGVYRAAYTVGSAGRYVARVTTSDDALDLTVYVTATTAGVGMPTVDDVDVYLDEHSWELDDLQAALDAESAAQRAVCRVAAVYPADLREALLRRVARNLALRRNPLGQPQGDADFNFIPGRDPEVRRLEAPHRKLVIG